MIREVAPVKIVWIPGNHDIETSYYLTKIIWAWYNKDDRVEVDVSPTLRKAIKFGKTFIGWTHGDEEPHRDLPRIFMDEFTMNWAKTKFHEIHIGHFHKKKEMNFVQADTYGSTKVVIIPSLSGTDYWHYKKGYIGKDRAAEAYIYDKNKGLVSYEIMHVGS